MSKTALCNTMSKLMQSILLTVGLLLVQTRVHHCETYHCDADTPCSSPIMCNDSSSNCSIVCSSNGYGGCSNFEFMISESYSNSNTIVNLTCSGYNACSGINFLSYRQGFVTCRDDNSDTHMNRNQTKAGNSCINSNITMINLNGENGIKTKLSCFGADNCRNVNFYCDDTDVCQWNIFDNNNNNNNYHNNNKHNSITHKYSKKNNNNTNNMFILAKTNKNIKDNMNGYNYRFNCLNAKICNINGNFNKSNSNVFGENNKNLMYCDLDVSGRKYVTRDPHLTTDTSDCQNPIMVDGWLYGGVPSSLKHSGYQVENGNTPSILPPIRMLSMKPFVM